jgi:hypothetical protein
LTGDPARSFNSAHNGHPNVENGDIDVIRFNGNYGFLAICDSGNDVYVWLRSQNE